MKNKIIIILTILSFSINVFTQSNTSVKCEILSLDSFAKLPDNLKLPGYYCGNCSMKYKSAMQLDRKIDKLKAVILTFTNKKTTSFVLENNFKNITLIKKENSKSITPYAIVEENFDWKDLYEEL